MAHHQRSFTQKDLITSYAEIPLTNSAFSQFCQTKSLESFSQVADTCLSELQDKSLPNFSLPKDIQSTLIHYLTKIDLSLPLHSYIPCLSLLQNLLSNTQFPVTMTLVSSLCHFLTEVKSYNPSPVVIHTTFVLIETLFHLALSRRKKSDNHDPAWITKIFLTFGNTLTEILTKEELIEIANAEYELTQNRVSIESRVLSKGTAADLVLYLVVGIYKLAKILTNVIPNDVFTVIIPSLLQHAVDEYKRLTEFDVNGVRLGICMEKSVAVFQLINTVCALTAKLDLGKELIKTHCDKIQVLFYLTVFQFFKRKMSVTSVRFEEDESVLGRLYQQLFELITNYLLHSELEAFPIQELWELLTDRPPVLQVFTQSFILKALEKDLKKTKMSDTGIVNLLFSPAFFRVSGHTSLFCECENTWTDIWNILLEHRSNTEWIPACVVSQVKLGKSDLSYLYKINDWIHEVFNINPQDLERYIRSGLLEEMLEGIISQYSLASNEFITDFFISLKSIISMCEISSVSAKLVNLMLQEDLVYDTQVSELTLTCLAILMRQQELSAYVKYLTLLENAKNFEVQKKLLECVQNILNDSESRKWCQENFVQAGVFRIIRMILEKSHLEEMTDHVWVSCMECIRFIIQGGDGKVLECLNLKTLSKMLLTDLFKSKRQAISEKISETLFLILVNRTTVEGRMEVVNPHIVPLLLTTLSVFPSSLYGLVAKTVKIPHNAAIFSRYSGLEFLIDGLQFTENQIVLKFLSEMLETISTFHISPLILKKILTVSSKLTNEKQLLLLKSINTGFSKCFTTSVNKSGYTMDPSHFVWFVKKEDRIECFAPDFEFLPKKEFSIVCWVFVPEDVEGFLWELTEKRSQLCLEAEGSALHLFYVNEKKIVFSVRTYRCLVAGSWNLVSVCSQQAAKLMKTHTKIEIFVNGKVCEKVVEGKISLNHSFHSFVIGNNSEYLKSFLGKVGFCVVLSKYFEDFSGLMQISEEMHLGFVSESVSVHQKLDQRVLKEFVKYKHFEYCSNRVPLYEEEISVIVHALLVPNGNVVHSLSSIGGLEVFLLWFKECFVDKELVLALMSLICTLTKSRSVGSIMTKDFFEVLGNALETYVSPSKDLLAIIESILENLDWNPEYQRKVFTSLLCNQRIWISMSEKLSETYLEFISGHVSKHFDCNLANSTFLYSHLITLYPVPGPAFVQFFTKVLPQNKLFGVENLDAVSFLLFRIMKDCPQIMELFLQEFSLIEIEKKCAVELTFLILHVMDWVQKFQIQSGAIRVLKSVMKSLTVEPKDKKLNSDFCAFIFAAVDKILDKSISLEVFQALMDMILSSFTCMCREDMELFEIFADILSNRFSFLSDKVLEELNKVTSDYQFCDIILKRQAFPTWLFESYLLEKEKTVEFSLNLFKHTCNPIFLLKLRQFLLKVAKIDLTESLTFYHKVLLNLKSFGNFETIVCFLDFASILEDLINTEVSGRQEIDAEVFSTVVGGLVDQASILSLIQCTYPTLPKIDFSTQLELMRQRPSELLKSEETIFLRDGGFLRMVLKYIFIGMQIRPSGRLIGLLKTVMTAKIEQNCIIYLDGLSKQASDKLLLELNPDRFSSAYSKFPNREMDSLFSEEFLCFYILVELTEILNSRYDEDLFEYFLKFLQETNIDRFLVSWSKRVTSKELDDFYKLISDYKFSFFTTARSRLPQMDRNSYLSLISTVSPQSLTTFQFCIYEQAEALAAAKKLSNSVKDLLNSPAWITKAHFFLVAYTSMKLNFIGSIAKFTECKFPPESFLLEDYPSKLTQFISSKQEELKQWQINFSQSQDRLTSLYQQRLSESCNKFKKVDQAFVKGKVKLRWVFDSMGRIATCIKQKSAMNVSTKRSKSVSIPVEHRFKGSFVASTGTESSVGEESETGTLVNGGEEDTPETIPAEQQKILKTDCERIKVSCSIYGELEVCSAYLLFISDAKEKPIDTKYFGSALKFTQELRKTTKLIECTEVSEVFARRFIHKPTAFELFLKDGHSFYFNVFSKECRDEVFEVFKTWRHVKVVTLELCAQYVRGYTKRWKNGEISNFEYLMVVNKCASRSFNDISQYPVFPWVVKDYYSTELKLEDEHVYRNFKLPVGAQTETGRQEADRRFSMWIDEQPYHFGSHYSSGAIVLYYLIRIEPFSTQAKILQGGKFDIADRLFHSLQSCWESGQGTNGDVKELIPELFYLPEVFLNINSEDFGCKQDEETVENVELPRWADSPIDFIRKHRAALESAFVSSNLNNWIDLIFGYKQKGKQAQNSYNMFCPMTYGDNFLKVLENCEESEGYMQGLVDQVVHFGQTPVKIFNKPHPVKDLKPMDCNIFDKYKKFFEGVYYGCETNGEICAMLMTSKYLLLVKSIYSRISIIRINLNEIEFNRVVFDEKKEKILEGCIPFGVMTEEFFAVFAEKRIVSVCQADFSFTLHNFNGKLEATVFGHTDSVTCVHCSKFYIVTGSKDSSIMSWEEPKDKSLKVVLKSRFFGHDSEIVKIRSLETYQILFSLGKNGKILLHDLRNGECLKGFLTQALGFDVSNLGVISYYTEDSVVSLTVNGSEVGVRKVYVSKVMFDNSGENLYYCYGSAWGFFNLFEAGKGFEKDEAMQIIHIGLPLGSEYLVFAKANDKMNFVFTFELIQKETFRVIRKHNIFQDL